MVFESFLMVAICILVALKYSNVFSLTESEPKGDRVQALTCTCCLIIFVTLPVFVIVSVMRKFEEAGSNRLR